ncbi:serine/threonine protein kinase [Dictyobacter arantiisoli]|uniref:non-specific serine/threonine protein kinase n=1 Tax=Dictyobacter arantiisoli TaxID=2014874 RepID=A0A5A5T6D2_9CHLR|nr:serine/threonine-protein kinase [Dictyobacter arantiisoli]GCF06785.1 hypothetical protein KDI_03490 [Dictyobacter arantiisoli]
MSLVGSTVNPYKGRMIRGYCLEELLEDGTVTLLYRARTEELWLPSEVFILLLPAVQTLTEQEKARFDERFTTLARRLMRLRHPSLSPLYGYGEEGGLPYLILPPQTGETLAERLSSEQQPWELEQVYSILAPLAHGLSYLHSQKVIHQFLNPANIILRGSRNPPAMMRVGLAQMLGLKGVHTEKQSLLTRPYLKDISGSYLGAPEYLAPEVVKGAEADTRSDIYTLGVILFALLSGQVPFAGEGYLEVVQKHIHESLPSLHKLAPAVPAALEMVVNRALQRDPRRRFQTTAEFMQALRQFLTEKPLDISSVSPIAQIQAITHSTLSIVPSVHATPLALREGTIEAVADAATSNENGVTSLTEEPAASLEMEVVVVASSPEDLQKEDWLNSPQTDTTEDEWLTAQDPKTLHEDEKEDFFAALRDDLATMSEYASAAADDPTTSFPVNPFAEDEEDEDEDTAWLSQADRDEIVPLDLFDNPFEEEVAEQDKQLATFVDENSSAEDAWLDTHTSDMLSHLNASDEVDELTEAEEEEELDEPQLALKLDTLSDELFSMIESEIPTFTTPAASEDTTQLQSTQRRTKRHIAL